MSAALGVYQIHREKDGLLGVQITRKHFKKYKSSNLMSK